MAKIFLIVLGTAYTALAVWCVARPEQTARSIGLSLLPGSGQSEYQTVYGGLQLGLGLFFLWAGWRGDAVDSALLASCFAHGGIVALRTASLVQFSGISSMTYGFAALEWVILLASGLLYWQR